MLCCIWIGKKTFTNKYKNIILSCTTDIYWFILLQQCFSLLTFVENKEHILVTSSHLACHESFCMVFAKMDGDVWWSIGCVYWLYVCSCLRCIGDWKACFADSISSPVMKKEYYSATKCTFIINVHTKQTWMAISILLSSIWSVYERNTNY